MCLSAVVAYVHVCYPGLGCYRGREFCFGEDRKPYRCEIGYCCGDTECCTFYYELWWFWLAWTLIILVGCCCAYRHRRFKLRHQQELRQREISLMAYQGVAPPVPAALEPWPNCKLPTYDEVTQDPPTPPPPYCEILDETPTGLVPPVSSTGLNMAWSHQEDSSTEAAEGSSEEHQQYDIVDQGSSSALERRRHVTGDSGIVLCDEKVACLSEREETDLSPSVYISVETEMSAERE
ncbi:WW domain-binding protein 1-like isoform X1 [Bufo gargarizans]|uniref:WW domain-binding protein 1-like isoform X1 n=1 Tax=Bufo gargarizans TaxID=30331 RepID=UPI001CF5DF35|nr:WW domain-binding protein 1-like isoform X1 [Bufo gargarizans]